MRLFAFGNKQTEQKKTAHQLSKEASIEAHQVWICAHRKTIRTRHTRKKNVVEERHRKNERISNKQPSTYIYLHILHYNIRPKWATKNYRRSLTRSLSSLGTPLTWVLVLSLRFPCSRLCVYFSLSLVLSIQHTDTIQLWQLLVHTLLFLLHLILFLIEHAFCPRLYFDTFNSCSVYGMAFGIHCAVRSAEWEEKPKIDVRSSCIRYLWQKWEITRKRGDT